MVDPLEPTLSIRAILIYDGRNEGTGKIWGKEGPICMQMRICSFFPLFPPPPPPRTTWSNREEKHCIVKRHSLGARVQKGLSKSDIPAFEGRLCKVKKKLFFVFVSSLAQIRGFYWLTLRLSPFLASTASTRAKLKMFCLLLHQTITVKRVFGSGPRAVSSSSAFPTTLW